MRSRRFFNSDVRTNLIEHLKCRGLLSQVSSPSANRAVESPTSVYLGADPTAKSLHLGNLVPLMVLLHFYIRGHNVFPLIGGATGFVGDPSGRATERQQMENKTREENCQMLQTQFKSILENGGKVAKVYEYEHLGVITPVNNYSWWSNVSMLGFLSTFGRHIRVSQMLARDSVKQRLGSEQGIGFNEFTYQVLQAYDFWHLYSEKGVQFQLGGNDQWGNITAGIDLISRLKGEKQSEAIGLTVPLLTTPSGEKFGKSAGNAIFINKTLTRPYNMYQYLLKSPDSAVESYLKMFTLVPLDEIATLMEEHKLAPEEFKAQHRLALEVTQLIHGPEVAANAKLMGQIMFEGRCVDANTIIKTFDSEGLLHRIPRAEVVGSPWKSLLARLAKKSKSEADRLVQQGAVYKGLTREPVTARKIQDSDLDGNLLLVRVGKTEYYAALAN